MGREALPRRPGMRQIEEAMRLSGTTSLNSAVIDSGQTPYRNWSLRELAAWMKPQSWLFHDGEVRRLIITHEDATDVLVDPCIARGPESVGLPNQTLFSDLPTLGRTIGRAKGNFDRQSPEKG